MKKVIAILVLLAMLVGITPVAAFAASKQMRDGVPVWTQETVEQYALDFIHGNDFERLFGYYDLQVRRYMPMDTFTGMLNEIEWMTGDFVALSGYSVFAEPEQKTKTHTLHLHMEKQDLELYFTQRDKEDDWEIMAVEFVPAEKKEIPSDAAMDAEGTDAASNIQYTETEVKVGAEPYVLSGILTMPSTASATTPVAGVVLVHDSGANDMDETIGQTKLFKDIADTFAKQGIATLRYDKRTFAYADSYTQQQLTDMTIEEEVIQDAIAAGELLKNNDSVDPARIVLLGHSFGATLAPRIVSESEGVFTAMMLLAGSPNNPMDLLLATKKAALNSLEGDALVSAQGDVDELATQIAALKKIRKDDAALETDIVIEGRNGYYYWDLARMDSVKLIKKLKLPAYIVQGHSDTQVSLTNGIEAYEDGMGSKINYVSYKIFRKLNHLLMLYMGPVEAKGTLAEFDTPAVLDRQAGRNMADWVLALNKADSEE